MLKIGYGKFNGLGEMLKKEKSRINFARTVVLGTILAIASSISIGATYYVDPVVGLDTNTGTTAAPWKTIAFAQSKNSRVAAGDIVYLKAGNYGNVLMDTTNAVYGISWNSPIIYKAVTNADVVFTTLSLTATSTESNTKRYLIFEDIKISAPGGAYSIRIDKASHLKFNNITAIGTWGTYASTTTTGGVILLNDSELNTTEDIYIENCEFSWSQNGVDIAGKFGENIVIRNVLIHDMAASAIKLAGDSTGKLLLIEGCNIYNQSSLPLSATNPDTTHGSGLSIRRGDFIARNNIIHNYGGSNPIRFYQDVYPIEGYCNVTFENNLVYDSKNTLPVLLQDIGNNVKFNNNTIIGKKVTRISNGSVTDRENRRSRYDMAVSMSACTNGATNVEVYNNVLVGEFASSGIGLTKPYIGLKEDNNIIFGINTSLLTNTFKPYLVGNNTIIICHAASLGVVPTYIKDKDYFEGSGKFFVGGELFDLWSYNSMDVAGGGTHGQNLDDVYRLADGSEGIGFSKIEKTPIIDLDFNVRDAKPDAGCYEYLSATTTPEPATPAPKVELVIAPIDAKTVTEGQALAFDVVVTGAVANLITCTIENLPAGATFINKHFQWTPKSGQAGLYFLKIVANSADANTATRYVAVTVQQNVSYHTPAFGVFLGTSVFEAEKLYVTVNATDPDGDKLLIEAVNLPVGAIFYENTLIWVPDYGTAGTYKVQFTASDGINKIATEVSIVIKKATSETYPGKRLIYYWQTTLSLLGKI